MIGSAQAPAGTAITAKDAGVLVGTATVDSSGNYGISVSGTTSGDTIQFYVGGIAAQTGTFTSGEFPLLNLTIPAPTYAVTLGTITRVSGDTDSTVTIATSPAIAGATVTLTVVPKTGMQLKAGTLVATYNGTAVATLSGTGPYTFTMPVYAVSVTAEFEASSAAPVLVTGITVTGAADATTAVSGTGSISVVSIVSTTGVFTQSATLKSSDGNATVSITTGTTGTLNGSPLSTITVTPQAVPPSAPTGSNIVGIAYDFGPSGAIFTPPITMTISYNPANIPTGVPETSLVVVFYNTTTNQWVVLPGSVDNSVAHTITVPVSHFTLFTVMTPTPSPSPSPSPTPTVSPSPSATVSPTPPATIVPTSTTPVVTPTGGTTTPPASTQVTATTTPPSTPGPNVWLIVVVVVVCAAILLTVLIVIRRRKRLP